LRHEIRSFPSPTRWWTAMAAVLGCPAHRPQIGLEDLATGGGELLQRGDELLPALLRHPCQDRPDRRPAPVHHRPHQLSAGWGEGEGELPTIRRIVRPVQ